MQAKVPIPTTRKAICSETTSPILPSTGFTAVDIRQLTTEPREMIVALLPEGMFSFRRALSIG